MTSKSIATRIQAAIDDDTRVFMSRYLELVRENMQQASDKFHSTFLLIIFLMAVFELLNRAAISEVTLGPFKLSDVSLLIKLLPVVIAYYYYLTCTMLAMIGAQRTVIDSVVAIMYGPLYDNDLEYYLYPVSPLFAESLITTATKGRIISAIDAIGSNFQKVIWFLPLIFQVYAFYRCFRAFGFSSIIVWVALVISAVFCIQGVFVFASWNKLTDDDSDDEQIGSERG